MSTGLILRYDKPIKIEYIAQQKDVQGAADDQWAVLYSVLGDIVPRGTNAFTIFCRYMPGVENSMRVRSQEGVLYRIISVAEHQMRRNILRMECVEQTRCEVS